MKVYPGKHLNAPFFKRSSSERCCHLPLILWLFFSLKHPLSPCPDSVSSTVDSSKIQLLSRRVPQEKWGTLSIPSGLGVSPEECISLSHSHTNNFNNGRRRLYCFTRAHPMDTEMMIHTDLSFQVSPAPSYVFRAVRSEGPAVQFWTTAHIWCF